MERERLDFRNLVKRFESSEPQDCFREAQEYVREHTGHYSIASGPIDSKGPGQILFYAEVYRN